eukprot:728369-Hanusia_phi.AAC.1
MARVAAGAKAGGSGGEGGEGSGMAPRVLCNQEKGRRAPRLQGSCCRIPRSFVDPTPQSLLLLALLLSVADLTSASASASSLQLLRMSVRSLSSETLSDGRVELAASPALRIRGGGEEATSPADLDPLQAVRAARAARAKAQTQPETSSTRQDEGKQILGMKGRADRLGAKIAAREAKKFDSDSDDSDMEQVTKKLAETTLGGKTAAGTMPQEKVEEARPSDEGVDAAPDPAAEVAASSSDKNPSYSNQTDVGGTDAPEKATPKGAPAGW